VWIAGWILLVVGLVLCVSIAWAPLGLVMMGVGLVSLQVAERNRRKARTTVAPANASANKPMEESATSRPKGPRVFREPPPTPVAPGRAPAVAPPVNPDRYGYDREEWRRLVESDSDLAQLASVLGDYGQQYVDAFARNYLAAPNKNRIAGIVDGIIARAGSTHSARKAGPSEREGPPATQEPKVTQPQRDSGHARFAPPAPTAATEPTAETATPPAAATAVSAPAEAAAGSSAIAAVPPLQPPPEEVTIEPPKIEPAKPGRPRDSTPGTSADDDLSEMLRKFAPDSSFLRRT
jgi:hypothetical protein